jgi:hypothetical protein
MSGDIAILFKDKPVTEKKANANRVVSLIKDGKIKADKVSLRQIGNAIIGRDVMDTVGEASQEESVGQLMRDAADPVNLQMFSNITGALVYQGVIEQYNSPDFIGDQLVTAESSKEDVTREVGLAPIDDNALVVQEAGEFPSVKFGEDYIDVPASQKRGLKIAITREMIFFDKTGQVTTMAQGIGKRLGIDKEKRILRIFLGITNNFVRKGVARNTYVSAADPRINQLSNPMVDWTDFDDAMAIFTAMTDDRSVGEPIMADPDTIVTSPFKKWTVDRILHATDLRTTTNTNTRTDGPNPLAGKKYNTLSSPWLDWLLVQEGGVSASNAKQYWHFGEPKKAFVYRTLFPLAVRTAGPNDIDDFERDIVMKFRADERGVAYVRSPWHMLQNTN